ncbi:MAG: hypothetical protein LBK06_07870 [Planctomycetaceae bacterium]|nr:hypothetical protein [Planctomycetaceae bacterium]
MKIKPYRATLPFEPVVEMRCFASLQLVTKIQILYLTQYNIAKLDNIVLFFRQRSTCSVQYAEAVLKFAKLITAAQQRGAVVQGRSLLPYRLRYIRRKHLLCLCLFCCPTMYFGLSMRRRQKISGLCFRF